MKLLATSLAVLAATSSVYAGKIAGDQFNYAATNLNGQNGGFGWNGAWATSLGPSATATTLAPGTAFSYSSGSLNLPATAYNGAAQFTSSAASNTLTSLATRTLSAAATTATNQTDVYLSFMVRFTTGTLDTSDSFYLWFGTAANSAQRYDIGLLGSASNDFFVRSDDGTNATSTPTGVTNSATTTYFVVGRLKKNTTGNFDQFSVWVNPSSATEGAPNNSSTPSTGEVASLTTLGFGFTSVDSGDAFQIDNFQIGDSWADVITPVPFGVDSTAGLALLGAAAAWKLRRRRAKA